MDWGWIPLLDFAISIKTISEAFRKPLNIREEFEFTESDSKIIFNKHEDKIQISTTFSSETLETDFQSFVYGVKMFYKSIINEIIDRNEHSSSFKEVLTLFKTPNS